MAMSCKEREFALQLFFRKKNKSDEEILRNIKNQFILHEKNNLSKYFHNH